MEEAAQRMDVDLPLTEEAKEIDSGNDHIPETQDDCLSLPHIDNTKVVEEEEEEEELEKEVEEEAEEEEEEQEEEEEVEEREGDFEAEQQQKPFC